LSVDSIRSHNKALQFSLSASYVENDAGNSRISIIH